MAKLPHLAVWVWLLRQPNSVAEAHRSRSSAHAVQYARPYGQPAALRPNLLPIRLTLSLFVKNLVSIIVPGVLLYVITVTVAVLVALAGGAVAGRRLEVPELLIFLVLQYSDFPVRVALHQAIVAVLVALQKRVAARVFHVAASTVAVFVNHCSKHAW